jgi:hypothetical protein
MNRIFQTMKEKHGLMNLEKNWKARETDRSRNISIARVKSERKVLVWVLFFFAHDCVGIPLRNRSRLIRYYLIIDSVCRFVPRGSVKNQIHPGFFITCCMHIVSFSPSYLTLYPFRIPPGTRGADTSCWRSSHGVRRPGVHSASHSLQHACR